MECVRICVWLANNNFLSRVIIRFLDPPFLHRQGKQVGNKEKFRSQTNEKKVVMHRQEQEDVANKWCNSAAQQSTSNQVDERPAG